MAPNSRFGKRSSSDDVRVVPKAQPRVLTRSPPSSIQAEYKNRPREPYPVPSSNPASQYTLLEKLGTGSFGTVYKAMHNETKQIVAIKQIGTLCLSVSDVPVEPTLSQILKILTTTFRKYSKKSLVLLNVTLNTSHDTMAPSLLPTSSGLSWNIWLVVHV